MRWSVLVAAVVALSCRQLGSPVTEPEPVRTEAAVARPRPRVEPPAVVLHTARGPVPVHVEVARTEPTRNRGLMYRREMPEDHGMVFVFPRPDHQVFWMHNTILALDMVFIRADRTVLGIVKNATPETDDSREVPGDSKWVLEVNAGFCDRHHVAPGDRVELIGIPEAYE